MAEIKIEKKKPVWPWILLLLIVAAVVAFFVYQNNLADDVTDDQMDMTDDADDVRSNTDTNNMDTSTYNSKTTDDDGSTAMMALMTAMKDSTKFGIDSLYTRSALKSLTKLTIAKAYGSNLEASTALTNLEKYSDANYSMEPVTKGTNMAAKEFKNVSADIVYVLEDLRMTNAMAVEKEIGKLKETSAKLNGTTTLAKQQTTIQLFFRQAHDLLHNMNS